MATKKDNSLDIEQPPVDIEEKSNVVPFERPKARPAAFSDGETPSKDWLSRLPVGTVFLSKVIKGEKKDSICLQIFEITDRTLKGACRLHNENNGFIFVDPTEFSDTMDLYEVLGCVHQMVIKPKEEED